LNDDASRGFRPGRGLENVLGIMELLHPTHSRCSNTLSFRGTATTARFFAAGLPRWAIFRPCRRSVVSGLGGGGPRNVVRRLNEYLPQERTSRLGDRQLRVAFARRALPRPQAEVGAQFAARGEPVSGPAVN
jgi:hypothetical protein